MKLQPHYENQVRQKFSIQGIFYKGDTFLKLCLYQSIFFAKMLNKDWTSLNSSKNKMQNKDWLK